MPYIRKGNRALAAVAPNDAGELTFAVQQLLRGYLDRKGRSYQHYAECMGALRGAELDLWDRQLKNHEHVKCGENGDVW